MHWQWYVNGEIIYNITHIAECLASFEMCIFIEYLLRSSFAISAVRNALSLLGQIHNHNMNGSSGTLRHANNT